MICHHPRKALLFRVRAFRVRVSPAFRVRVLSVLFLLLPACPVPAAVAVPGPACPVRRPSAVPVNRPVRRPPAVGR